MKDLLSMMYMARGNSPLKQDLQKTSPFSAVDEEILDFFTENALLKSFNKGQIIFLHADKGENFYIIKSGWVKIFRETLDGQEAIIDIMNNCNVFGEVALFNDYVYNSSAMAVENSELISIPLKTLEKALDEFPSFAQKWLKFTTIKQSKQDLEVEHHLIQTAPQKIGCFLLRLCPINNGKSPVTLHLPYDKNLVATRLGMKAETFSRGLQKLKEASNIEIKGATIIIHNIGELSKYCCSACSSSYPCKDLE